MVEKKRQNLTDGSKVDSRKRQEEQFYDRNSRGYHPYSSSHDHRPSVSPERSNNRPRTSHHSSSRSDYRQSSESRERSHSRSRPSSYRHDDASKERQQRTTTTTAKDSYPPTMERQRSSGRAAPSDPRKRPAPTSTNDSTELDAKRPCTDTETTEDMPRTTADGKSMTKSADDHGKATSDQTTKGMTNAMMPSSNSSTPTAKSTNTTPGIPSGSHQTPTSITPIPATLSFKPQINALTTDTIPTTNATRPASATTVTATLSSGPTDVPANASAKNHSLVAIDRPSISTDPQQTATTTTEKPSDMNSTGQQPTIINRNPPVEPTAAHIAPSNFTSFANRRAPPTIPFGSINDKSNVSEKPVVIQLICAGAAIHVNAIGDLEDYLTQNLGKAKCRTMFFPAGVSSREDILKQVHMDGVNALILLEPGFEHHENVFLQVYDQQDGGKDSLHFDGT